MNKKQVFLMMIFFALATFQLVYCPAESNAKPIKLRYWTHDSPNSYRVKEIYNVFADRVKEATNGEVIIKISAMTPITNPRDAHDAAAAGVVDIACCMTGVSIGRYPILDSICLPGLGLTDAEMSSVAAVKLVQKFPVIEERMGNVKIIEVFGTGVDMVGTSNKPVRKVADFNGLKLRSSGTYQTKLWKSIGISPVIMGPGDIYPNMQKGVIDGFNMPWGGILIFKLDEVTNYCIETNCWAGVFFSVMNRQKWDSLSPENQEKIKQLSNIEWSRYVGKVTDRNEDKGRAVARKAGAEVIVPSPEFRAEILEYCKPIWAEYVADVNSKGLPGQKVLDELNAFVKSYQKVN